MDEDLFAPTTIEYDPETNYLEQLVGEGKKFTDQNKLAYSALEKDRFIDRLKQENEEMRKSINSSQRLEELVTKLSTPVTTPAPSNDDNHNSELDGNKGKELNTLTSEQVEQLLNTKLMQKDNFSKSIEGIKKTYGPDYQNKLDLEAKKLGLSADDVNTLAKSNPELFLRVFNGSNVTPSTDNYLTPPTSSTNTFSLSNTSNHTVNGVRTEAYYKSLKATDPKKYWSKEVQSQEYKDAMKLGNAFFNA